MFELKPPTKYGLLCNILDDNFINDWLDYTVRCAQTWQRDIHYRYFIAGEIIYHPFLGDLLWVFPYFPMIHQNIFWAYFSKWNLKKPLMTLGTSRDQLLCFPVMLVWLPAPPWCFWLPWCFPCDGFRNPNLHGQFIPAKIGPSRNSWFTH